MMKQILVMFLFDMEPDEKDDDWNESSEVEEEDDPLFEVEKENADSAISRLNN